MKFKPPKKKKTCSSTATLECQVTSAFTPKMKPEDCKVLETITKKFEHNHAMNECEITVYVDANKEDTMMVRINEKTMMANLKTIDTQDGPTVERPGSMSFKVTPGSPFSYAYGDKVMKCTLD